MAGTTDDTDSKDPNKDPKKKSEKKPEEDVIGQVLANELLAKLAKKHGSSIFKKASEYGVEQLPRIPTGIFLLDYALGGGFPVGRVNLVYGHKSSSKTTTVLKAVGNAQKMCANCYSFPDEAGKCKCKKFRECVAAYIDVEGTWDAKWAALHGVDLSRLIISVPEYAEQSLDIAEGLVLSGKVDVIVLDSIAFLTPAKEIEESTEKDTMGGQSRLVGKGVRKLVAAMNTVGNDSGRRPTLFLINQIRMKIGLVFGNPETTPGGMAPGFAASTEIMFRSGKYEMDEITGKPLSVEMKFKIEKNKTSAAKMEGEYKMILSQTETKGVGEILEEDKMVEMGERMNLVEKKGADWYCIGEKFAAKSHIERRAMTDSAFKRKFGQALMTVLLSA